jgi:hypothetical protein
MVIGVVLDKYLCTRESRKERNEGSKRNIVLTFDLDF